MLENVLRQEGLNLTAFLSWAKRKDYIETDKEKKQKEKRINGSRVYCVCIKLKEDVEIENLDNIYKKDLPF